MAKRKGRAWRSRENKMAARGDAQEGEQEGKNEAGDAGYNSQPKRGERPAKDQP